MCLEWRKKKTQTGRKVGDTSLLGMTQITFIASCGAPDLQFQYYAGFGRRSTSSRPAWAIFGDPVPKLNRRELAYQLKSFSSPGLR